MKLLNVSLNLCNKYYEKVLCYLILLVIIPGFFIFEMAVVRPKAAEICKISAIEHFIHILCSTFCFINVSGNMIMSIVTDTSLKRSCENGVYCVICRMFRPEGGWHCVVCNACIVRRDHHCGFFANCIGLYNRRYYISFLAYVTISMVYSIYYNYIYVSSKFEDYGLVISVFRIVNPLFRFMIPERMGVRDLYTLFLMLNAGLLIWSSVLFVIHLRNALRGVTMYENKMCYKKMTSWKVNLENVFGERWFLAILLPFVYSALPGNVKIK